MVEESEENGTSAHKRLFRAITGWKLIIEVTIRMAIANGTCVSFCNQLKAHFGLPWVRYASGTIAVNVTWTERRFNAGQTHRSMFPSVFSR